MKLNLGATTHPCMLCSWVRKGIGSSLSRLVRMTVCSPLRLTCEPSSPISAFSHILFSWVRACSFRVPFRQLSARPYRTLALISVKGRKLTTRPHILKLSSQSQKWRAFPETSAERFTFLPVFRSNVPFLNAIARILKLNSEKQKRRPLRQTYARLVPSPLRCLSPVIRFLPLFFVSYF